LSTLAKYFSKLFSQVYFLNSLIVIIWWIIFNPGFYSGDSFAVIEMARSGKLNSDGTAIWAFFVSIISLNGKHPEMVTLALALLTSISLSLLTKSLLPDKKGTASSVILSLTPLVGVMAITLWHDIAMTCGFILVAAAIIRKRANLSHSIEIAILGLFFSSFRYNGLPTILLFLLVLLFKSGIKKFILQISIVAIIFSVFSVTLNLDYASKTNVQTDGLTDWMTQDLSCYAAKSNDSRFFQENFYGEASIGDWASSNACTWFRESPAPSRLDPNVHGNLVAAWFKLAKAHPEFILKLHAERNAYLVPLPIFGLPSMPFLHTTIEYPNEGIESLNPGFAEIARVYPRTWNYFNFIFGYVGFWLLTIFYFGWKRRSESYLQIGLLGLILSIELFIASAISDARYGLFVLLTGQLIFIYEVVIPIIFKLFRNLTLRLKQHG